MFCKQCGKPIDDGEELCEDCKKVINNETATAQQPEVKETVNTGSSSSNPNAKSKIAAGLLGIFLGQFGVHNFYLGYTGKAVTQLLLTIFGYILAIFVVGIFMVAAAGIWGLVEGIMILSGSINTDANGIPLKD